jgi:hypothetical protein
MSVRSTFLLGVVPRWESHLLPSRYLLEKYICLQLLYFMKRTVSVAVTTLRFPCICVSVDTVTVTVTVNFEKQQEQGL